MRYLITVIYFLFLFINNLALGQIPQSSNLIAYYPFSGNANDSSGNGYDGTISGDPQLTTDRFGNSNSAYNFDGNGDWIYFGTDTLPANNGNSENDAFTISVWAQSFENTTMDLFAYGGMVSCGGGLYGAIVRLASNIQFNSCNRGFNTSTGGTNNDGQWHHYVVTWNGSNARRIYIDGSLAATNTQTNVFRIRNVGLVLGRSFMDWTLGNTLNASADELRLWKNNLTADEVQTLYNMESTPPPILNSSVPADNATSVALDSTIVLNFSSNVDAESGNITIKKTSDDSTVETIDVTSGQVSGSGTSQITVTPSSNFENLTQYYVLIDATAFDDSVGNSYEGISSTTALSFTTVNAAPTLSSSVPADNATSVALDSTIVLNFSENVDAESGNITIKKTSDNSTVETIDVTSGQVSGSGTSQITITPSSNFESLTQYYVLIDATAFDDTDSGSYAGISSTTALSFTTANAVPTLSSSVPADNATGVALNSTIVLNFSENVDAESGNITIKKTSDNSTIETIDVTSGQVSGSGSSQITITPSSIFDSATEYYVLIDATAFDDTDSGSYAGISSTTALSFTSTNAVPTLSSSVPADNATDIARDTTIVLNFSENVDAESGNITIKKTSDNSTVETIDVTSSQVSGSGTSQITITPSSNFENGIEYYVLIDATAFDDTDSGSYAGISSTTALNFTIVELIDPTTDKNVIGLIEAQNTIAKNTFTEFNGTVSDRLKYLRLNRIKDDLSKNNLKLDFGNAILTSLTNNLLANNDKPIIPRNWSTWSEGSISVSKIGDTTNASRKEIDTQSIAFGFDKKINEGEIFGYAFQYGQSDTDINSNGSGIDSKNYNFSMYRTRPLDDNNFIEGLIGIGKIKYDIDRKSGSNTLTGSRDGNQLFGSFNFGKTINKDDFDLIPSLRINLGYTELDEYQEVGTNALFYDEQHIKSGIALFGLAFNNIVKFDNSSLKPFASIEYGLDMSDSSDTRINYVSDKGTQYTYKHDVNSEHLIKSDIGFNFETKDNLFISSNYQRIQGEKHEHTDTLSFGLNFKSKRETEYAMQFGGTEDLSAGLNIAKNINGLNFNFKLDKEFNENLDKNAEILMIKKF